MNASVIHRNPAKASATDYDLIVVGGGIYGVCATLEASRRGLRTLLLEMADFGSGTSSQSLRILHGGLRYLQSLALPRFRRSVAERQWFMANFPELVEPLNCLMPLYGKGLRRPAVFRIALKLNDLLSRGRNQGVEPAKHLEAGRVLSKAQTIELFPAVDTDGLVGGAVWQDGLIRSSERLQIELHKWAANCGATQLNYMKVAGLQRDGEQMQAIDAIDQANGQTHTFRATKVLNTAGGWSRDVAMTLDKDVPALFPRSLAFNLLLDVDPPSSAAVAVEPKQPDARTYFLVPWKGRLHAGTYHMPWVGQPADATDPPAEAIDTFISDLNQAVPGLKVSHEHILKIYAGQLPAIREGDEEMSHHAPFHEHGGGLFSLAGHKYTTARAESLDALRKVFPDRPLDIKPGMERPAPGDPALADAATLANQPRLPHLLSEITCNESVVRIEDLLERRLDLAGHPEAIEPMQNAIHATLGDRLASQETELEGAA